MRKVLFVNGEFYHVFNRGAGKGLIFPDHDSFSRFLRGMEEFNTLEPIGSLFENSFRNRHQLGGGAAKWAKPEQKLVNVVCYCLNPNHYHFILEQLVDRGIEKFMHKLGTGYTGYFQRKYDHSGVLLQGPFKAVLIDSNEYLLHLSAYVNLNYLVHRLGGAAAKSSWEEYTGGKRGGFCEKGVILDQFKNAKEYKVFAEEAVLISQERKDMEHLLLE